MKPSKRLLKIATDPNGRVQTEMYRYIFLLVMMAGSLFYGESYAGSLADTIAAIKPGVVGVGTVQKSRRPPSILMATGFVVGDGFHALTNAHVIPEKLDEKKREQLAVFSGEGKRARIHPASVISIDEDHDIALLEFSNGPLHALTLGDDRKMREGDRVAFTGFPLGGVLGLFPSTNRGIVSAIAPIVIPAQRSRQIDRKIIERLQDPYPVFQLDATAYPGHSGSPLYEPLTGHVVGIVNMVFVKGTKEHAITDPSGITYAIPIRHAERLLRER